MNHVRDRWKQELARLATAGLEVALDRLAEFGWCKKSTYPGGLSVEWDDGAISLLRACRPENDKHGIHVVRFCLLLDLLAMQIPPSMLADLVSTPHGEIWAMLLLADLGRKRYQPAWWDLDRAWHEMLRAGDVRMPIFFPWVVEEGLWRTARRLAELGWLDFQGCETQASGCQGYRALRWREDLAGLLSLVMLRSALVKGGSDIYLRAAGRLSLLLQLKLMRAPTKLQADVVSGVDDAEAWASALAVRVTRGQKPLWWDKKHCWHAAARRRLIDQQVRAGLLPDAGVGG